MKNSLVNLKTIGLLIGAFFSAAIIAGCDNYRIPLEVRRSLKAAGQNRGELMAVINHFKDDSEKLQAAYYLISNMPGHYYIGGQCVFDPAFDQIKPILEKTGRTEGNGVIFTKLIDSIRFNNRDAFTVEEDIKTIRSDYLIENIDLAFMAYYSIPADLRCERETFLKFVLPYRNSREPIEPGLRKYFFQEYHWVFERMQQYDSFKNVICDLLDSIDIRMRRTFEYPFVIPLSNSYKIGVGNCDDIVNLAVFIFRALGIPAASDYIPFWGTGASIRNTGHTWIAFFIGDTIYAVDTNSNQIRNHLYRHEVLPKIYRRCFEKNKTECFFPNSIDVTNQYRNTIDIPLNSNKRISKAYLNLFHPVREWVPVDESRRKRGKIVFKDVGKNIVYAISDALNNKTKVINSPFYVNNKREIIELIPDHDKTITAILTRKYPPYVIRNLNKLRWVNSINGAEIQASNKTDFSDAVTLLKIKDFNSSNKQIIKTGNKEKYKNYRLVSAGSSEIHLSEFHLMKNDTIIMTDLQVFSTWNQRLHGDSHKLVDNRPLTYINARYLTVNYYFDEPVAISEFQIQARNDDNNVKPGCHYELMYWDDGWVSAGSKYANDTLLVYENIPSGALYWLRNRTEGIEEQIFLLDDKGYQYWPGVTSFNDSYHEFLELERLCNN